MSSSPSKPSESVDEPVIDLLNKRLGEEHVEQMRKIDTLGHETIAISPPEATIDEELKFVQDDAVPPAEQSPPVSDEAGKQ